MPQMIESSPETSVIVVTMQNEPAFARKALQAGAKGFVDQAVGGRRAGHRGPLGARRPDLHQPEPRGPSGGRARRARWASGRSDPREIEVLGLLALGYMNPEIADKLVLSVRTVETHRANIQRKTGISTRAELIAYAIDNELVER